MEIASVGGNERKEIEVRKANGKEIYREVRKESKWRKERCEINRKVRKE